MNNKAQHFIFTTALLGTGALSLGVVSPEDLEANKPQVEISKNGSNLMIDWDSQPEVFYFVEGSPDLGQGSWVTAKLLKDNAESGNLSLGTAVSGSKGFYRLSLEGDPNAERLRADDDGDRIINLLEAEADWDAFATDTSVDSDGDLIPDYFELFHFNTIAHDETYVATTGGLSLADAFANATNPNSPDSDGDGWTDAQEIAWSWNPNYNQSRDDGRYAQAGDFDGDGISNSTEVLNNTDPSDSSDCPDGLLKANYVLVDLGQYYFPQNLGNKGHVLLINEDEGAYYRRWYWGTESDYERYSDEWSAQNPFVAGYALETMNNDGQIGGKYVSQQPVSDSAFVRMCGEAPNAIPMYAPIVRNTEDPIIIEADGAVSNQTKPSVPISYSGDTQTHLVSLLNDNGDFVMISTGSTAGLDGISTSSSPAPVVNINTSGSYSSISSLSAQGIIVLSGSCDATVQFSGEMPFPSLFNNQGKVAGVGYESSFWVSSPFLQSGTEFFFVGNVSNRVSYRPTDLNQNGWVIGNENDTYSLHVDANQYAIPSGISGGVRISSPETDEHLIMLGSEHLATQREDTETEDLIPFSQGDDAFFVQSAEEILYAPDQDGDPTQNEDWSDLNFVDVSDNGKFLVGYATKSGATHAVLLLRAELVPDYNRDGLIDFKDRSKATDSTPLRWWLNDDDDIDSVSGNDQPGGGSADYSNAVVDTERDLVDFFPVFIDLKDFLSAIDDLSTITVKLKHADDGLNFVYTDLLPANSKDYWHETNVTTGYGASFTSAPGDAETHPIDSNGFELSEAFLTKIRDEDKGVILLEGASSSSSSEPLVLEVSTSNGTLFEYEMPLSLSPVDDMYHHVNLTGEATNYDGTALTLPAAVEATRDNAPNWPNEETNNETFAFLHGYKVNGQEARGWHAEVFKRLHLMGSNARFVGVTWHGATGLDYHKAVFQAFQTGEALHGALGNYSNITVAAHSLGNMVVSHAIQSHDFRPERYYMINAAVPIEAYAFGSVTQTEREDMTHEDWDNRDERLYASNWHQLFANTPNDQRNHLSWKGVFANVLNTETHNFFSPGEDVLDKLENEQNASAISTILSQGFNFTRGAWKTQELVKGRSWWATTGITAFMERGQAGWDRNVLAYLLTDPATITDAELRETPYFDDFNEDNLTDNDPVVASDKAAEDPVLYDLLARGIPALSYAAAVDGFNGAQDFDMEQLGRPDGTNAWPNEGHSGEASGDWLHSDFRNVALPYVYPMYEAMITKGDLNED
jgi:hypothetical protein